MSTTAFLVLTFIACAAFVALAQTAINLINP